jgi:hypothetical protein
MSLYALSVGGENITLSVVTPSGAPALLTSIPVASSGPGSANVVSTVLPFTYDTPSPLFITPILGGQTVLRAAVIIITPFDDPSAALKLGTPFSPALLLSSISNPPGILPTEVGQYETDALASFASADTLQLVIQPGASTQGVGVVFLEVST